MADNKLLGAGSLYFGGNEISKAYMGNNLVWEKIENFIFPTEVLLTNNCPYKLYVGDGEYTTSQNDYVNVEFSNKIMTISYKSPENNSLKIYKNGDEIASMNIHPLQFEHTYDGYSVYQNPSGNNLQGNVEHITTRIDDTHISEKIVCKGISNSNYNYITGYVYGMFKFSNIASYTLKLGRWNMNAVSLSMISPEPIGIGRMAYSNHYSKSYNYVPATSYSASDSYAGYNGNYFFAAQNLNRYCYYTAAYNVPSRRRGTYNVGTDDMSHYSWFASGFCHYYAYVSSSRFYFTGITDYRATSVPITWPDYPLNYTYNTSDSVYSDEKQNEVQKEYSSISNIPTKKLMYQGYFFNEGYNPPTTAKDYTNTSQEPIAENYSYVEYVFSYT